MKTSAMFIALTLALAIPSAAQTRPGTPARPRPPARAKKIGGFITVNGGYQATANDFSVDRSFAVNAESAQESTEYRVKAGPLFNAGGGVTLSPRFGVGATVGRFSVSTPGALSAAVPHPFFFNQPRAVSGDVAGLTRSELSVHVQARALRDVSRQMQVSVFGGPSFFRVTQDVVSEIRYSEVYPYDTATFSSAATTSAKASKIGFNVGGDVTYYFNRRVGVGGLVQFSGATVTLPNGSQEVDVKAGGLQAGGGLRFRF